MTKAYSYIRFSSTRQIRGDSLRRQTEISEKYASDHGLELDQKFHLKDLGYSAFDRSNIEKGALGGFLDAVKAGKIEPGSYLLVESLDRLSRDQLIDALTVFLDIIRRGIVIVTLTDGMVYEHKSMGENYSPLLISITIMARAHEESLTKSKRVKAAWANKINHADEKKLTARCPAWLELSPDRSTFKFIPERVEVVKEIIKLSKTGLGQWVISRRLNERREPNWSGKPVGWHVSYIAKILNNPALYGEFQPRMTVNGKLQPHGEPVANYFPALITKDEFLALQSVRKLRTFATGRKGDHVPNLMSGLLKCAYCGSSMNLVHTRAEKKLDSNGAVIEHVSRKSLMCEKGRRGLGCFAVRWDYHEFEKSFLMFCSGLELSKLLEDLDASNAQHDMKQNLQDELRLVEAKLEENGKRLQNLVTSIEQGRAPKSILDRMEGLEIEVQELHEKRIELRAQINHQVQEERSRVTELKSLQSVLKQLSEKKGDELFTLRAALADHIRRFIQDVRIYPAGQLLKQEDVDAMRSELAKAGFSEARIAIYVQTMRTTPERVGRSGRYASRREIDRYFIIRTRGGGTRIVTPDFDDPAVLRVESPMYFEPVDEPLPATGT